MTTQRTAPMTKLEKLRTEIEWSAASARETVNKLSQALLQPDAGYALEWSDAAFGAAAEIDVLDTVYKLSFSLQRVEETDAVYRAGQERSDDDTLDLLIADMTENLLRMAGDTSRSTTEVRNVISDKRREKLSNWLSRVASYRRRNQERS
jgi:hypothetical protein